MIQKSKFYVSFLRFKKKEQPETGKKLLCNNCLSETEGRAFGWEGFKSALVTVLRRAAVFVPVCGAIGPIVFIFQNQKCKICIQALCFGCQTYPGEG